MGNSITLNEAHSILEKLFNKEWERRDLEDDVIVIDGKVRHLFVVSQSKSYQIELERGFLYASAKGHPVMRDVAPGDIIFSVVNGEVVSVEIAMDTASETLGNELGYIINCVYCFFSCPISLIPLRSKIAGLRPFDKNGYLPQAGYIHHLSSSVAYVFITEAKKAGNTLRKL
ncbi:MAG: hypothetical protein IKT04_05560 [Clostridia bacterium]|nr:hypothetical protein [Clostridia bacterium]